MEKLSNISVVPYVPIIITLDQIDKHFYFQKEVEPMARESDNIHIIALTKAAIVPIRVIYMDHSQQSSLTIHDFAATDDETNGTFEPMITMLYRPGHYDLLYES